MIVSMVISGSLGFRWKQRKINLLLTNRKGFLGGSVVKNLPANAGDAGLIPAQEDPLEKEEVTHSSILAWEVPGQRSLVGHSLRGHKRAGHDLATKQQQNKKQKEKEGEK